jgi:methyl-accepting chemotaxis protein
MTIIKTDTAPTTERSFRHADQWKKELEAIGKDIASLEGETERQFLVVGKELGNFHARARSIETHCSSVVTSFSGEGTADIIRGAKVIVDRMGRYLDASEIGFSNGIAMLDEVLKTVPKIDGHLSGFKKMVKNLGMLSISIKIESSQLKDGHDFVTIAGDVEKLSVLISSRISDILARVRSLQVLAQNTFVAMGTLENKQKDRVATIVGNAQSVMLSIDEKNGSSVVAAESISKEAELLAKNIGEIVSSIQFHDITRQQIEHVKEALDAGASTLAEIGADGGASLEDHSVKKAILWTRALCRLQERHLDDAVGKFTEAVKSIVESLVAVAGNVSGVCDRVEHLTGRGSDSLSSSLSSICDDLSTVAGFLGEIKAGIKELSGAVGDLGRTAADMTQFVEDIEEIGSEIELIAVNARIKAAHTGDEGAPLGVIAEVIQKLSGEARSQKTAISEELRHIVGTVERLRGEVALESEKQETENATLADDLDVLLKKLKTADDETARLLSSVETDTRELAGDIDKTAEGLTVHRDLSTVVEGAVKRMDSLIAQSLDLLPQDDEDDGLDTLKDLERNYTMHSERIIHHSHAGSAKAGLYGIPVSAAPETRDHFADNVELF